MQNSFQKRPIHRVIGLFDINLNHTSRRNILPGIAFNELSCQENIICNKLTRNEPSLGMEESEVKDKLKNGFSGQQWLYHRSKAYTTSTGYFIVG